MKEPKIRFKGFSGEWKRSTLGDLALFSKGSGYSKSDICKEGTPVILYGRMYTKYQPVFDEIDTFVNPKDNSVVSKGGEVIIPGSGESSEDISLAAMVKNEGVILGGDLNILKFNQKVNDPAFMSMTITYSPTRAELSSYSQGKTVVHLRNSEIAKGTIRYPDISEQNTIVNYVLSLDAQISASTSRLASLKQMKAACLQAMFPQEGETVPKVRFKGFEGEWKKVKLSECLEISTERNLNNKYGVNEVLSVSDEEGVMNQIKLLGRSYAGKSVTNYKILRTNQVVYTKSPLKAKPYGIVKVNKGETGIVSVLYAVYDAKECVSPDYIHYYFEPTFRINNYLLPLINKGAKNTMNISDEVSLQGDIILPNTLEEQLRIVEYLQTLDRQIALHAQLLEKLKQIKAACLDKMFV
ncbi:restriction endonuclease subunit S [Prevotellamassilia timonensis]|uniref:restriction endonuclease subunit S n=1 Tax=Prevotellamassilia timonensis TaxID=1852370 RepID=UPI003FEEE574